jgi:integrase/recombinase XerD
MNLQDYLNSHYSPKTAKAYSREIIIYLSNSPGASKALYPDIVAYMGHLRNRYHNPKTLNRILASIKAYYGYLSSTGQRKDNPARGIRLRDRQNRDIQLQDLFTSEELEALLKRKERYNALEYRNKVLMGLLVYQALRPAEIAALTVADIDLAAGSIHVKGSSKTNSRQLSLKPHQVLLFHQYQSEIRPKLLKEDETTVFILGQRGKPMTTEDITKHVKRSYQGHYSPRKVNCLTIRQSVIANLLKAGNDLRLVQVFAGHKYPSATEKYRQSNIEALKTAVQHYHPMR